jgi:L,D-transpeptidase ErfK/SrfK
MHHTRARFFGWSAAALALISTALLAAPRFAHGWNEDDFARSPLVAYPIPTGRNDVIGALQTYTLRKGDTLLDVGRWFGLSAREISDANNHMDWWTPPVGKTIVLPTEHILPMGPHSGIVVDVPELRLYYYPSPRRPSRRHSRSKGKLVRVRYSPARVVYTFPVGLGRYDWRTPVGKTFRVTAKEHNPPWIVPKDIYEEHLERDGYAEHMIPGGDPDNPEGHWRLDLNLPAYAIHGTNNPWGVGMEVSHGCIRLDPEAIDRLWHMVPVGTTGRIVYQPVKYGWRGGSLYVEVHEDLYGMYPGLWRHAISLAKRENLLGYIDKLKLEKAVEEKTGVPTYVMPGLEPASAPVPATVASSVRLPPPGTAATTPDSDSDADAAADTGASASAETGSDEGAPDTGAPRAGAPLSAKRAAAPADVNRAPVPPTSVTPASADASAANSPGFGTGIGGADEDNANDIGADTTSDASALSNAAGGGSTPPVPAAVKAPANDETRGWEQLPAGALPVE